MFYRVVEICIFLFLLAYKIFHLFLNAKSFQPCLTL